MKPVYIKTCRTFELSSIAMCLAMISSPLVMEAAAALGVTLAEWPLSKRLLLYALVVPMFGAALTGSLRAYKNRFLVIEDAGIRVGGTEDKLLPWTDVVLVEEKDANMNEWRKILIVLKDERRLTIQNIKNYEEARQAIFRHKPQAEDREQIGNKSN